MDTLAVRRIKVLDGLFYSFKLLDHHHAQLYPTCSKVRENSSMAVAALAACWGFVDVFHRARELAQLVPGLSRRNPELKRFLQKTHLAEEYRHYIQHLRGELANTESHGFPVWGSLSWVDADDESVSHTAMIGSLPPDARISYSGAVFDTVEKKWVSRVSLGIRGSLFNFDPMLEAARSFETFVIPYILERCEPKTEYIAQLTIFSARFVVGNSPPNHNIQPKVADVTAGDTKRSDSVDDELT